MGDYQLHGCGIGPVLSPAGFVCNYWSASYLNTSIASYPFRRLISNLNIDHTNVMPPSDGYSVCLVINYGNP